jgi:hypothetical protein
MSHFFAGVDDHDRDTAGDEYTLEGSEALAARDGVDRKVSISFALALGFPRGISWWISQAPCICECANL